MKWYYFIVIVFVALTIGCSEQEPDFFVDTHFIRFKFDKTGDDYYKQEYNFAEWADDLTDHEYTVPVEMKGRDLDKIIHFGVAVDKEKTTLPADCFTLNEEQAFRPEHDRIDSMRVTFHRKAILKEGAKVLRLKLVASQDFQLYMSDSCYVEISVVDIFSRPIWWDSAVENAYLGTYSKEKYDAFMEVTGAYEFGTMDPSEKRYYTIMFKRALEKEPRYEKDGSLMTVEIPG